MECGPIPSQNLQWAGWVWDLAKGAERIPLQGRLQGLVVGLQAIRGTEGPRNASCGFQRLTLSPCFLGVEQGEALKPQMNTGFFLKFRPLAKLIMKTP